MSSYMEKSLTKLAMAGAEWHSRFADELAALVHHSRIELPKKEHVMVVVLSEPEAEYEAYAQRHNLVEPVYPSEEAAPQEEEEAEEEAGPQLEEAGAPRLGAAASQEDADAGTTQGGEEEGAAAEEGADGGGEEDEAGVPEAVRAEAKLVASQLPSLALVDRKYGRHRRERLRQKSGGADYHAGQRGAHHRYVLDMARETSLPMRTATETDVVVQLGLLSLLSRQDGVRLAVARALFDQPGDMLRRAEAAPHASLLMTAGPTRDPREWIAFLDGLYGHLDATSCAGERLALLEVDRFNDRINTAALPPEERAHAPSLRLKRYLSSYVSKSAHERLLLWDAVSPRKCSSVPALNEAVDAYMRDNPRIPPETLQLLLYLAAS
jgi:hypothetical protein